jgi:predicted RNase H-related nuclease YkuK (DUF458 family)
MGYHLQTKQSKKALEEQLASKNTELWKIPEEHNRLYTLEDIFAHIAKVNYDKEHEYEVAIGTDSQIKGCLFRFITVVCIWKKGKGGMYYYKTKYIPKYKFPVASQKLRMFDEVAQTIELASKIEESTGVRPIVHVDASIPHKKEFTSSFSEQLKGYVVSCGYECILKPESYVANCIADRHTKRKLRSKEIKEYLTNG